MCSTALPSTVPCSQSSATPASASAQKVRNDCISWSERRELLLGTVYMGIAEPRKDHHNYNTGFVHPLGHSVSNGFFFLRYPGSINS